MYTSMVLLYTCVPGDPKITIPPSVGLWTILLRTIELRQATLMPSAHCWKTSTPAGPMSLFWTVMLEQVSPPSATCRHDQLRGSYERTYSMSWPEFWPPNSMLAPPVVIVRSPRLPKIWAGGMRERGRAGAAPTHLHVPQ